VLSQRIKEQNDRDRKLRPSFWAGHWQALPLVDLRQNDSHFPIADRSTNAGLFGHG
jgi:hypothetical protein